MPVGGIQALQNMQAYAAAENSRGKLERGTGDVENANQKRRDLQAELKKQQAEMKKLEAELDQISGKSDFEKFMGGLFGSDCGAGEVGDKMATTGAELKKTQQTLASTQAQIEMMLQELNGVQTEFGARSQDRQKAYDENGMTVNNIG